MDTARLLEEVKKEIARLQKVADLLEEGSGSSTKRGKRKPMSQATKDKIAAARKAAWKNKKSKDKT
jgi:uncharacterized SAM-dependent methyltransferase